MAAMVADIPGDERQTQSHINDYIERGYAIQRVTLDEMCARPTINQCTHRQQKKLVTQIPDKESSVT